MPIPAGPGSPTAATVLPHVQAVMAMLDGGLPTGCHAYLAGAPKGAAAPYVVAYPDPGQVEQISLVPDEGLVVYLWLHGVGKGAEQALWALDAARAVLIGAEPNVTGRVLWRIWQESSASVTRDDDVNPPLYVAPAEFGVRSEPA